MDILLRRAHFIVDVLTESFHTHQGNMLLYLSMVIGTYSSDGHVICNLFKMLGKISQVRVLLLETQAGIRG